MVNKTKKFLIDADLYKMFVVLIGILLSVLVSNMTFSLNRLVKVQDINTISREHNKVVDAQQETMLSGHETDIVCIKKEVKDIDRRVILMESIKNEPW